MAFLHGVVWNTAAAWAFVIPAILVICLAFYQWRRACSTPFQIHEFVQDDMGRWWGVLGSDFRLPTWRDKPGLSFERDRRKAKIAKRHTIYDVDSRTSPSTTVAWHVEKGGPSPCNSWFDILLSDRERNLLSLWSSAARQPALQWCILLGFLAVYAVILSALHGQDSLSAAWTWIGPLAAMYVVRGILPNQALESPTWLVHFPVTFAEVCRASQRREVMWSLAIVPLLLGYELFMSWRFNIPRLDAVFQGLALLILMEAALLLVSSTKISGMSNDTQWIRWWVFWLGGGILFIAFCGGALLLPQLAYRAICLLLAGGIAAGMSLIYSQAYARGGFDLGRGIPR